MKKVTKNKVTNPEKRDLFVELKEGVSALTEERQGGGHCVRMRCNQRAKRDCVAHDRGGPAGWHPPYGFCVWDVGRDTSRRLPRYRSCRVMNAKHGCLGDYPPCES